MKKCYGYLRVSGKSQIDGDGFPRQRVAIQRWAKRNGYKIEELFEEEAVSGTTEETERPVFAGMIGAVLKNGVRTVVIEALHRLAREYRIQEQIVVYLASKGVRLISADTGEDITAAVQGDPMKKALVQMQGVFSELDKSMLVKKLREARERKRAKYGKCEGRKFYGHTSEEMRVVGIIKGLRRKPKGQEQPMPLNRIARKLNDAGIPTRYGGEWQAVQVQNIINGPYWTKARVVRQEL